MKKLISLLLACLILASLSVAGFADDNEKNYDQNPADLKAMADCIDAGTTGIKLTDEYFTIPTSIYKDIGTNVKLSFQSSGDNVDAAIFILAPDNESAAPIPTQHKQNVSISSTEEEIEFKSSSEQLYIGYGARLGINFLTSVEQDTTITVKVYAKSSSTTSTPYTEAGTITYTLTASAAEEATPLEMNVACEDHSSAMPGKQVYVGDEVTVSFENADEFTGTSAVFSFGDAFELTGGVPYGWTVNDGGGYTCTKDESWSEPGAFTLTVKQAATVDSDGTLKLVSNFSDNTTVERTKTIDVIDKPIKYTIKNKSETIAQVTVPYNGQSQHVEVIVDEPANATVQYSKTSYEDYVSGTEVEWTNDAPEWTDACYPQTGHWVGIKITADGYETVTEWLEFYIDRALLTITPNDYTIYVGDRVPTSFTYTVDGLRGDDKLTTAPTFSIDGTVDKSKPGTYTIKASGADAGNNYRIEYGTATLHVVERPIDVPNTYDIDVIPSDNGTVGPSLYNASAGSTITLTVTPDEGYELAYITVDGECISGTSFTMPAHDVEVRAYFVRIGADMPFTDVNSSDWFYDYVRYVVANGLMEGTSATTFEPNANMTRAMVWAILARIDGETVTGANWLETARSWAMANGVSDGENANGYVTREQLVTMLWRFKGEPAVDFLLTAKDADTISDWAYEAMRWAVAEGIIEGDDSGVVSPAATATRAQAAAIFMRFIEL